MIILTLIAFIGFQLPVFDTWKAAKHEKLKHKGLEFDKVLGESAKFFKDDEYAYMTEAEKRNAMMNYLEENDSDIARSAEPLPGALAVNIYVYLLALAWLIFNIFFSLIPRARDIGWPAKSALLILIPIIGSVYGILLLIAPRKA